MGTTKPPRGVHRHRFLEIFRSDGIRSRRGLRARKTAPSDSDAENRFRSTSANRGKPSATRSRTSALFSPIPNAPVNGGKNLRIARTFHPYESGRGFSASICFTPIFSARSLNTSSVIDCFSITCFGFFHIPHDERHGEFSLAPRKIFRREQKAPFRRIAETRVAQFLIVRRVEIFQRGKQTEICRFILEFFRNAEEKLRSNSLPVSPSPRASISFRTAVSETPVSTSFPAPWKRCCWWRTGD